MHDPGHEAVDSIDTLLEIDESTTLRISFLAAAAAQMPAASSAAATPATRRAARTSVIPGDAGGGATDACRVEMPSSPGGIACGANASAPRLLPQPAAASTGVLGPYEDGDGELKYKKRRITARRLASLKARGRAGATQPRRPTTAHTPDTRRRPPCPLAHRRPHAAEPRAALATPLRCPGSALPTREAPLMRRYELQMWFGALLLVGVVGSPLALSLELPLPNSAPHSISALRRRSRNAAHRRCGLNSRAAGARR